MMVNLQHLPPTDSDDSDFGDEDDGRDRVLLVELNGRLYAINVTAVREVLRTRGVTRVPGAPPAMLGLVNVRGMVVTVLNLAACLGVTAHPKMLNATSVTETRAESGGSIVLLERGSRVVGLAVDAVRDVRPLDDASSVANAAEMLAGHLAPEMVQAVASAGGEVVLVLDVAALLARHLISSAET
jgi:purine-binding chemotaxis protein CheW